MNKTVTFDLVKWAETFLMYIYCIIQTFRKIGPKKDTTAESACLKEISLKVQVGTMLEISGKKVSNCNTCASITKTRDPHPLKI